MLIQGGPTRLGKKLTTLGKSLGEPAVFDLLPTIWLFSHILDLRSFIFSGVDDGSGSTLWGSDTLQVAARRIDRNMILSILLCQRVSGLVVVLF